jgi:hypothetical protein
MSPFGPQVPGPAQSGGGSGGELTQVGALAGALEPALVVRALGHVVPELWIERCDCLISERWLWLAGKQDQ